MKAAASWSDAAAHITYASRLGPISGVEGYLAFLVRGLDVSLTFHIAAPAVGAHAALTTVPAAESAPGTPEEQGKHQANSPNDHQDHTDRVNVEAAGCYGHCEPQYRADCNQK